VSTKEYALVTDTTQQQTNIVAIFASPFFSSHVRCQSSMLACVNAAVPTVAVAAVAAVPVAAVATAVTTFAPKIQTLFRYLYVTG